MQALHCHIRIKPMGMMLGALGLLLLSRPVVLRAQAAPLGERVKLTLKAGESYVINGVSPAATPGVKVIDNPHALVVHNEEPGKVVLVGAEAGTWRLDLKMADGARRSYRVTVAALAKSAAPLSPGAAPPALGAGGAKASSAAPPVLERIAAGPPEGSALSAPEPPESLNAALAAPAAESAETPAASGPAPEPPAARPPVMARQGGKFKSNPTLKQLGRAYATPSVSGGKHYLPAEEVELRTGSSRIIDFSRRLKRVSIADTKVADLQVTSPFQINLIGHQPGFTTLAVWQAGGRYEERQVRITPGGSQQVMLNVIIAELNRDRLEDQGINYSVALSNYGVSLFGLPGAVATPFSQQTTSTGGGGSGGSASAPTTLPLGGNIIPLLLSQNVTYGLAAQNSNVLTQTFFQFLEQHQLARILAEPHLVANSGEQAKFLSGGEIPIVIAQALNTSIVFKEFGTSVQFVPTVVGKNKIELLVKPEVSQPDFARGVQLFGFNVPAFVTRRAETLVRLHDNQTLIVAGLLLTDRREDVSKVPYLGDIPYLGALFRTTSYRNNQSDLVMSVTPQIIAPIPDHAQVSYPTSGARLTPESIRTSRHGPPSAARPRIPGL